MALADFNKAIHLNSTDTQAFYHRGRAYFHKGDYEKATADFTEVIRLSANDGYAYLARSRAYQRLGKDQEAVNDYAKAISFLPGHEKGK